MYSGLGRSTERIGYVRLRRFRIRGNTHEDLRGSTLLGGFESRLGIDEVSRRDTSCLSVTRKAKSVGKRPVKHERVIHTRVPVVLEEELKRFADNLRVPISNLIRTILEDALAVADRAGHRVDRELRSGLAQLARGREILRRKLTRRIPRRMPRG